VSEKGFMPYIKSTPLKIPGKLGMVTAFQFRLTCIKNLRHDEIQKSVIKGYNYLAHHLLIPYLSSKFFNDSELIKNGSADYGESLI
jgi:hypothetical protein